MLFILAYLNPLRIIFYFSTWFNLCATSVTEVFIHVQVCFCFSCFHCFQSMPIDILVYLWKMSSFKISPDFWFCYLSFNFLVIFIIYIFIWILKSVCQFLAKILIICWLELHWFIDKFGEKWNIGHTEPSLLRNLHIYLYFYVFE